MGTGSEDASSALWGSYIPVCPLDVLLACNVGGCRAWGRDGRKDRNLALEAMRCPRVPGYAVASWFDTEHTPVFLKIFAFLISTF